jgi:hypothetical protein
MDENIKLINLYEKKLNNKSQNLITKFTLASKFENNNINENDKKIYYKKIFNNLNNFIGGMNLYNKLTYITNNEIQLKNFKNRFENIRLGKHTHIGGANATITKLQNQLNTLKNSNKSLIDALAECQRATPNNDELENTKKELWICTNGPPYIILLIKYLDTLSNILIPHLIYYQSHNHLLVNNEIIRSRDRAQQEYLNTLVSPNSINGIYESTDTYHNNAIFIKLINDVYNNRNNNSEFISKIIQDNFTNTENYTANLSSISIDESIYTIIYVLLATISILGKAIILNKYASEINLTNLINYDLLKNMNINYDEPFNKQIINPTFYNINKDDITKESIIPTIDNVNLLKDNAENFLNKIKENNNYKAIKTYIGNMDRLVGYQYDMRYMDYDTIYAYKTKSNTDQAKARYLTEFGRINSIYESNKAAIDNSNTINTTIVNSINNGTLIPLDENYYNIENIVTEPVNIIEGLPATIQTSSI